MRLSAFNLYVPDHPEPGTTLVYNTFSGAFAVLPGEVLAAYRRADGGGELDEAERALVDPGLLDGEVGILVASREAEEEELRAWYERMRSAPERLSAIVSTTFACNLDCTYCCQNDVLSGKMMDDATGRATAAWLAARALEIGAREVDLDFVGGEPLLHPRRLEQIVADVRHATAAAGITVRFGVITNGVFLTADLLDRWIPLGLARAQVTLDGDETTHSITRRARKRDEDLYGAIFTNAVAASARIAVSIKGNYQTDTAHGFLPLIHKLRAAGLTPGSRMKFGPALSGLGAPSDSGSGSCTWSESSPELMLLFNDEARRAGYDAGDPVAFGPCGFHLRHYFAVEPDGHIHKCPGFLGHPEWAVGHVVSGLTARYQGLVNSNPQRQCGPCAHRPHCAGGCVAAQWLKVGRAEGVSCELGYFESQGEELVKRKYALAVADSLAEAVAMFPPQKVPCPVPPVASRRGDAVALRVLAV